MIVPLVIGCLALLAPGTAGATPPEESFSVLEALVALEGQRDPRDGVATYYASRFVGRRTSSGERYHPKKLTAAHALLPLGTLVRVRNLREELEVVVRINDRCSIRHASRNLIDLSRVAAEQIGLWGKGMAKVQITPLSAEQGVEERLIMELSE